MSLCFRETQCLEERIGQHGRPMELVAMPERVIGHGGYELAANPEDSGAIFHASIGKANRYFVRARKQVPSIAHASHWRRPQFGFVSASFTPTDAAFASHRTFQGTLIRCMDLLGSRPCASAPSP